MRRLSQHRWIFVLAAASVLAAEASAAAESRDFAFPSAMQPYLVGLLPELGRSIALDETLLGELGALRASDLETASLDFRHAFRVLAVDPSRLPAAEQLTDALKATGLCCVPYCVSGSCKSLLCFDYDDETKSSSLLTVGRTELAAALEEGQQRLKMAAPGTRSLQPVLLGEQAFLLADAAKADEAFLLPATTTDEKALASLDVGDGERIRLADLRALVMRVDTTDAGSVTDDDEAPIATHRKAFAAVAHIAKGLRKSALAQSEEPSAGPEAVTTTFGWESDANDEGLFRFGGRDHRWYQLAALLVCCLVLTRRHWRQWRQPQRAA